MKTSNKILLGLIIFIFSFILIFMVFARITVFSAPDLQAFGEIQIKEFPLEKIVSLKTSGAISWNVTIIPDSQCRMEIEAPEQFHKFIKTETSGRHVKLDFHSNNELIPMATVRLYTPGFERAEIEGKTTLEFDNFNLQYLKIKGEGYLTVNGKNNRINNFDLELGGMASINLSENQIKDVHIEQNGFGKTQIGMVDGKIAGEIAGMITLEYAGNLQKIEVEKIGWARVKELKNNEKL